MVALYTECFFYKTFVIDADTAKADELINEIEGVHMQLSDKMNAGRKNAGENPKKYYAGVRTDLKQAVNELGGKLSKLA
ncbi:hypothetical protein D0T56_04095 [Dysgonomonas sp. 520]|nr:hypothetical protein [Dysgonomonas sp. 520]